MKKKKKPVKIKWETVKYKSNKYIKNANAVLLPDGKTLYLKLEKTLQK